MSQATEPFSPGQVHFYNTTIPLQSIVSEYSKMGKELSLPIAKISKMSEASKVSKMSKVSKVSELSKLIEASKVSIVFKVSNVCMQTLGSEVLR